MRRDHQIVIPRLNRDITHCDSGEVAALVTRPLIATVERDPQPELGAEEKQIGIDEILANNVRVAAN